MGRVLSALEQSGLQLTHVLMAQLEDSHLPMVRSHFRPVLTTADLTQDVSVLIEVKVTTHNLLEDALSRLDAARLNSAVAVGEVGLDVFASGPGGSSFPTTAVFDNCSLCLIRPRIIREGRVGDLLDAILAAGFEVSAIKTLHLRLDDCDEFFRVYKGIYRQYQEVIKYMASSPCLALEVRGEQVVERFRELCGPHDVEVAKVLRPNSLRARFGKNTLFNAVHCTDCPEDGVLESQFIFSTLTT
ncbi:hypothetical protein P43SY_010611 [Pythium insidiosum]|uniref:Nucleoside diphosphate kinase-like domain-containing protein n=1 Tax=Pythium insidiosum TaxID=114742 RepID=A0AAD5LAM3_PYTIN|nr:hypothetical protein P43SY_010611 [Pythium insidiosum]